MPPVDIPQDLFKRLEKHARGFDTPANVISRAVDALERVDQGDSESTILDAKGRTLPEFEALYPPNLTHTKVVAATFNYKPVKPANWNRILDTALIFAAKQIGDFDKLRKFATVNIVKGEKRDEGYDYIPEAGLSVQGQDANAAWRGVAVLAQNLHVPVEVSFLWRNKEGAEHPGKPGTMRLG
jgi:hypothetical protein